MTITETVSHYSSSIIHTKWGHSCSPISSTPRDVFSRHFNRRFWKHCCQRKYCSIWAIFPLATMFSAFKVCIVPTILRIIVKLFWYFEKSSADSKWPRLLKRYIVDHLQKPCFYSLTLQQPRPLSNISFDNSVLNCRLQWRLNLFSVFDEYIKICR